MYAYQYKLLHFTLNSCLNTLVQVPKWELGKVCIIPPFPFTPTLLKMEAQRPISGRERVQRNMALLG